MPNIKGISEANALVQKVAEYLMDGESLAAEMIEAFVTQGEKIIKTLADSHIQEHQMFLSRFEGVKKSGYGLREWSDS
jgi:hypothetical protein